VIAVLLETLAAMALVVFVAVVTFSLPRAVLYPDSWVIRKMACQAKILGFDFGYPDSWVIRKMACQAKILGFDFGP